MARSAEGAGAAVVTTLMSAAMALLGIAVAFVFTVFNGAADQRAWSWGAECVYLVLLVVWCAASVLLAYRGSRSGLRRWLAPACVAAISLLGWSAVLAEALRHPK